MASEANSAPDGGTVKTLRSINVAVPAEAKTYLLSPIDLFSGHLSLTISAPLFYHYDIDGDRFVEALKKFLIKYPILMGRAKPDPDTRCVIEVNPDSASHGIIFTEMKTEMSIADALLKSATFKFKEIVGFVSPQPPFYSDLHDFMEVISGQKGVMTAQLTHFRDGCCVNVCTLHGMNDGVAYVDAMIHLSNAYRGLDIPDINHDRSILWPDRLAERMPLGDDAAHLPRKVHPGPDDIPFFSFPDEPCRAILLYFSNDVIQGLKDKVKPFLEDGEFVSSNDVMQAFLWMLRCEIVGDKHPVTNGADLNLKDTYTTFIQAIESSDELPIIPKNYYGNQLLYFPVANEGDGLKDASLPQVLGRLALLTRQTRATVQSMPIAQGQALLTFYQTIATGNVQGVPPLELRRLMTTNVLKLPFSNINYGSGGPLHIQTTVFPALYDVSLMAPGVAFDGILAHSILLDRQLDTLKTSSVVKELAPGMKEFDDFTVEELKLILQLKDL